MPAPVSATLISAYPLSAFSVHDTVMMPWLPMALRALSTRVLLIKSVRVWSALTLIVVGGMSRAIFCLLSKELFLAMIFSMS